MSVSAVVEAIPYWHVDAFSAAPLGGNQAAVMVLERWLTDEMLIAIAAENRFAETAFVVRDQTGRADWELRWCTPTCEVAMCGHGTLASGHVLLGRDGGERVTFRTREAGVLEVQRVGNEYELALPIIATEPRSNPEAEPLFGAEPLSIQRNNTRYNLFEFADEATVRGLKPDLRALGRLGNDQFICTARGERTDIVSRVFVPGAGVDEDSVTGSAHAVLAPFWAERLGRENLTAHQASARGGDLTLRLDGDRVWLGGPCVTVVEGVFYFFG